MFTLRTVVSIATASKCAPITRQPILNGVGVTAAARLATTFSSARCFWRKCAWDRTSRTSARARLQNSRALLQLALHLLQLRLRSKVARLRLVLLADQQHRLRLRLRPRQQLLRPHKERRSLVRHLKRRVRLRQRQRHPLHPPVLLRRRREQLQMQVREPRPLRHPVHRRQDRRGQSKHLVSRRCTPRPGITCIFIRRAVSTLTRTCHPIVFSIERAASVMRVQQTL